jgi:hypothetical protein
MEKVSVLFLVFNRLHSTEKVFSQIRKYKPNQFFISADGPRSNVKDEFFKCEEVRNFILKNIDWDCEIYTLFRESNLGCGKAVHLAIDWFFEHVESGIILEDDCYPDLRFFDFANNMLSKYSNSKSVMHISGVSMLPDYLKKSNAYYYSVYPSIWGWATWRSSWEKYNFSMNNMMNFDSVNPYFTDFNQYIYWKERFEMMKNKQFDTWDYQWLFSIWLHNGISITPSKNLIVNIGFSKDANHTKNINSVASNLTLENIPIAEKINFIQNERFDDYTFYRQYKEINVLTDKELNKIIVPFKNSIFKKILSNNYTIRDKFYIIRHYFKSYFF